ncbi:MAG: hypothetical protein KC502_09125 [Myxococcales bacterium]|nr:hypothetical protein [Myxococcales bacterium]
MTARFLPVAVTLAMALVACGSDPEPTDQQASDASADAAAQSDGGQSDGGSTDTGSTAAKDTSTGIKCHPVNNTGCPAGEHCIWSGNSIVCEADGEHGAGEECGDGKGCKIGVCVGVQGSDKSVCSPHCLANLECNSGICNKLTDSKGKVCDMGVQVAQCAPFKKECDAGQSCYSGAQGFICLSNGKVEAGQPCPDDNSCLPGHACVGKSGSGNGVCRKVCKMGGGEPSCDDISTSCSSLLGSSTVGYCGN